MHGDRLQWAVLGALLVLAIVGVWTLHEMTTLGATFKSSLERKEATMQTLTEEVTTTTGGRKITVSTTRNENESLDAWIARHNAAVVAAKAA